MIIIFQLGNLCMRNKGTLFSAHIFPTYHQTQLCVIGNHSRYDIPHTHTFVSIV